MSLIRSEYLFKGYADAINLEWVNNFGHPCLHCSYLSGLLRSATNKIIEYYKGSIPFLYVPVVDLFIIVQI